MFQLPDPANPSELHVIDIGGRNLAPFPTEKKAGVIPFLILILVLKGLR